MNRQSASLFPKKVVSKGIFLRLVFAIPRCGDNDVCASFFGEGHSALWRSMEKHSQGPTWLKRSLKKLACLATRPLSLLSRCLSNCLRARTRGAHQALLIRLLRPSPEVGARGAQSQDGRDRADHAPARHCLQGQQHHERPDQRRSFKACCRRACEGQGEGVARPIASRRQGAPASLPGGSWPSLRQPRRLRKSGRLPPDPARICDLGH